MIDPPAGRSMKIDLRLPWAVLPASFLQGPNQVQPCFAVDRAKFFRPLTHGDRASRASARDSTRQRTMRPGKKALAAFVASHDVDELLDGHDFASRVVRGLHDDMGYFRSTDPEPGARGGDARDRVERLQRIHQGAFKSGAQAWGLGVRWSVGPCRSKTVAQTAPFLFLNRIFDLNIHQISVII